MRLCSCSKRFHCIPYSYAHSSERSKSSAHQFRFGFLLLTASMACGQRLYWEICKKGRRGLNRKGTKKRPAGIEPATSQSAIECSTTELKSLCCFGFSSNLLERQNHCVSLRWQQSIPPTPRDQQWGFFSLRVLFSLRCSFQLKPLPTIQITTTRVAKTGKDVILSHHGDLPQIRYLPEI